MIYPVVEELVHGAIHALWSSLGWERSVLGYTVHHGTVERTGGGTTGDHRRDAVTW